MNTRSSNKYFRWFVLGKLMLGRRKAISDDATEQKLPFIANMNFKKLPEVMILQLLPLLYFFPALQEGELKKIKVTFFYCFVILRYPLKWSNF